MLSEFTVLGYLDPATGSTIVQVLIAAVLSTGVVFRHVLIQPIAALFGRRKSSDAPHHKAAKEERNDDSHQRAA